jgi:cell division protein FtsI (penicillin-binding protein 3)
MASRWLLAARVDAIVSARRLRRPPGPITTALLVACVGAAVLAVACATPEAVTESSGPATTAAAAAASTPAGSTIDPRLQAIAEEELGHAMDEWSAAAGTVLVLDPKTGEILANAGRAHGAAADVAIRSTYVTGSTLKAVTLAAALEEGVVSPADRFDGEQGSWTVGGKTIHDWAPMGSMTVPEMVAMSSNIGFGKIYERLGGERLGHWLRAFHFGVAPAIDGAASGWMPDHVEDHTVAGVGLAIGMKVTASPLQVAAAYAAIANGGVYVAPTLTHRTLDVAREALLRPETARNVVAMLEGVVASDHGTGTAARVEGQKVAGKTGTAQWELPDGSTRTYSSFVGFVPSTAPRFVILVGVEQPKGDEGGGAVAAPVFARVATRALAH